MKLIGKRFKEWELEQVKEWFGVEEYARRKTKEKLKEAEASSAVQEQLAREQTVLAVKEKIKNEALPEAARLEKSLDDFLGKFGQLFDEYQERVRNLQLQAVRTFKANLYLKHAIAQLDELERKNKRHAELRLGGALGRGGENLP